MIVEPEFQKPLWSRSIGLIVGISARFYIVLSSITRVLDEGLRTVYIREMKPSGLLGFIQKLNSQGSDYHTK